MSDRSYSRSRSRSPAPRGGGSRSRSPPARREPKHMGTRDNPPESNVIGIFGMSLRTDERTLRDVCERYGKLTKVAVVLDKYQRSRGFAFVTYDDIEDAREAKDRINGKDIDGREVRCDFSITKKAHEATPGQYMGRRRRSRSPPRRRYRSRSRSRDRYSRRSRDRYERRDRSRSRDRYDSHRSRRDYSPRRR